MRIQRVTPINELLAKIIFLLLPTLFIVYFMIWSANDYYTILNNQADQHILYFGLGLLGSALFHSLRFRFLPFFILIFTVLYLIYKGIDATAIGEFDTFFLAIQFRVFSILFSIGWIMGWGFMRLRFFSVCISMLLLSFSIILLARQNSFFTLSETSDLFIQFASVFAPIVLYSIYVIFTAELIRNYKDKSQPFWWYMARRLVLFSTLAILLLSSIMYIMKGEIQDTMAAMGNGGESGNSMLKKNSDNTFDLEQYSRLSSSLGRSNEPLFAAYINNFFEDSDIPNPLYLTAFYYAQFDTLTETFERDSLMPDKDLFTPDPSKIPLFFTQEDSTVLQYALQEKYRKTVEIEVYKQQLSAAEFAAPSTSFFVQPITIEKDFQHEFKSAYRAKSLASELNSAYFVYNANDPIIKIFQEQRFEILRSVKGYENVDKALMKYYTYMPSGGRFDRIKHLAQEISQNSQLPIDKVIAIRDYFLSKDEYGEPLFSYSDNPGIPDIPSASNLEYFLFENRKGYCAYYAGATLFMLRALGIPSRITVGFLTVDRSGNKNQGWYWYYADQAHAWVQVYFPGYGWLDFDTTVGNDDARESPQADGTPPLQPPKAYLAADGVITFVDTAQKRIDFKMHRMVYHDKEYQLEHAVNLKLDMQIAAIRKDSVEIPLSMVSVGDSAMAVSYAEAYKKSRPKTGDTESQMIANMPSPAPIDEMHIKQSTSDNSPTTKQEEIQTEQQLKNTILIGVLSLASLFLLFLLLPRLIMMYYTSRHAFAKNVSSKAYFAYRSAGFYLHQIGYPKGQMTAMQQAKKIDQEMNTSFTSFMNSYLKLKYANVELKAGEKEKLEVFLIAFIKQVKKHVKFSNRFWRFFLVGRALAFYTTPEKDRFIKS